MPPPPPPPPALVVVARSLLGGVCLSLPLSSRPVSYFRWNVLWFSFRCYGWLDSGIAFRGGEVLVFFLTCTRKVASSTGYIQSAVANLIRAREKPPQATTAATREIYCLCAFRTECVMVMTVMLPPGARRRPVTSYCFLTVVPRPSVRSPLRSLASSIFGRS